MEIINLIKARERMNVSDIYIFLHEDGPVAFESSADRLKLYFPKMEMESMLCSDRQYHRIVRGFALGPVLEWLSGYPCLVDDECIRHGGGVIL